MAATKTKEKILCYHCGDECRDDVIAEMGKSFCCEGCKLVHELLEENNLCTYYNLDQHPGNKPESLFGLQRFEWLDDAEVVNQLLSFSEKNTGVVKFSIPKIHCTSCIYLLEYLHKLEKGIIASRVDFTGRTVTITFNKTQTTLRKIVEVLHRIGYEPELHMSDLHHSKARTIERGLIYKIGVAGFCFGNIMMLSFPEYLTGVSQIEPDLKQYFSYLNLMLALPVFFFSAADYFVNSWKSAKQKYFSIDLPIALGLTAMLIRSIYEIFSGTGPGYFDSMSGLVFFLLIGRYFQSLTYHHLSFDRDYQSYFPVAVTVRKNKREIYTPVSRIAEGDKIVIHSEEIIPADAYLLNGLAQIDYSFVTGESAPVVKQKGELIYAGGRQKGAAIELEVKKKVEQSYLTQLWNHQSFRKQKQEGLPQLADTISKYFTIVIIAIAAITAIYWIPRDIHRGILACTAILIIACPCALAITVPFTFGNITRIAGRNNFYLKNSSIVEAISKVDTLVFDKTGTLTHQHQEQLHWEGNLLTGYQTKLIKSLAVQSIHPLSKAIASILNADGIFRVKDFKETAGKGIQGIVDEKLVKIGSAQFIKDKDSNTDHLLQTRVYVSINGHYTGYLQFANALRKGLKNQLHKLSEEYEIHMISGDNNTHSQQIEGVFPSTHQLLFRQSPEEKLKFIEKLQCNNKHVMMFGDGLNDAGALQQSDVGVSVSDDLHLFSPACDVIMKGSEFHRISKFIRLIKSGIGIIWFTFFFSLFYNVAGITYAVRGELSPMIAAILMPLSSLSVILITSVATKWKAAKLGF